MQKRWIEGSVVAIRNVGTHTKHYDIQVEEDVQLEFKPGQFVTFDLPIGEKRLDRWRSYSIASSSIDDGIFSLCIVKLEGGKASTYIHDTVEVGTILQFKKPQGTFTLPQDVNRPLVLICTGTGVAPFRSMIQSLHTKGAFHYPIHLIFGTRVEADILYRSEFEELARVEPNFKYDIALSRAPDWEGYKGYVHQIYKDHYDGTSTALFYLCGWSMMVDQAQAELIAMGIDPSQIIVELYG